MTFGAASLFVSRTATAVSRPKTIVVRQLYALLVEFPIPIAPVHDMLAPRPPSRYRRLF
jgi:hypothetical protein